VGKIASVKHPKQNTLAMKVANIGFLLDRLGQDCHPLQFLRELTQNSIEAIKRSGKPGSIIWDVDWNTYELENIQKLCVTDTGDGMSGDEMVQFINQLSSSVSEQSFSGNYGVGAKIAAATRNHLGVVYTSWKSGQGSMIHLHKDSESQQYGLKQWEREDGSFGHYLLIDNDVKPEIIGEHGTMVALLGNHEDENTMTAPVSAASPSRWISKYLNTRYFRFPDNVTIKAREGWEYPRSDKDRNYLRNLTGQQDYLQKHSDKSGRVQLSGATGYWWILKDEPALANNSGYIESAGHIAALYQDELYEMSSGRAGMSKLQQFGVTFGYRQVVLYIEPANDRTNKLTTNTSRTSLLINNESLPWADWAADFREKIPPELAAFIEEKAQASVATDHTKTIRDRLKEIMDLFKVSRYKPSPEGSFKFDEEQLLRGGLSGKQNTYNPTGTTRRQGASGGTGGNIYSAFEKKDGLPAHKVNPDLFPEVRWVTVENDTRTPGMIEDRAAKFLPEQNLLLINADFRVYNDMKDFFLKEYGSQPAVRGTVDEAVRNWFEQSLIETIL